MHPCQSDAIQQRLVHAYLNLMFISGVRLLSRFDGEFVRKHALAELLCALLFELSGERDELDKTDAKLQVTQTMKGALHTTRAEIRTHCFNLSLSSNNPANTGWRFQLAPA